MLLLRHVPSTVVNGEAQVVPVVQDRSWQCHSCTYEQDFVPGSRMCVMCHSTRRRLHCAPQRVGKSKLVVRTRGSGKSLLYFSYDCPNCHLAERCKACLISRREKCVNDTWGVQSKDPLKKLSIHQPLLPSLPPRLLRHPAHCLAQRVIDLPRSSLPPLPPSLPLP
jgi:hypothetical protein